MIKCQWSQTKEHLQIPNEKGPGVRRNKRSLLACQMQMLHETTHKSVVKLGIKVVKLVESLIVWEITWSRVRMSFKIRKRLHIA